MLLTATVATAQPNEPTTAEATSSSLHAETTKSKRDECLERRATLQREALANADLRVRTRLLQALPDCNALPERDTATAPPDRDLLPHGLAFEGHIELARVPFVDTDRSATTPGLFVGYQTGGLTLGVGLEIARRSESQTVSGTDMTATATSILVIPGIRATLARTADLRTELIGEFDAGIGTVRLQSPGAGTTSALQARLQAGPGIRYWVKPSLAIGSAVGVRYDRSSVTVGPSNMAVDEKVSTIGLFGAVQALGVF